MSATMTASDCGGLATSKGAWAALPLVLLLSPSAALAEGRFERAAVYLERSMVDKDVEIRFEVTGPSHGLAALRVTAPDGRTVLDVRAPDSKLGMRQFVLESPEPNDDGRLQADFPAGTYQFSGTTVQGTTLQGTATLSHAFPPATSVLQPRSDDKAAVPAAGLQIRWSPVANLAAVAVVVEDEETGREVTALLPGDATAFTVPQGVLAPATKYKLGIGTVSRSGNRSFVETQFKTAGRE